MPKHEIVNNDSVTLRVAEGGAVDAVLENAEKALDVIENRIDDIEDGFERAVTVTKNNPFVIAGVALVVGSAAAYVAYRIAVKRTTNSYELILKEEIAAAKAFHRAVNKEGYETPADAVDDLVNDAAVAMTAYQGTGDEKIPYNRPDEVKERVSKIVVKETPDAPIVSNVFDQTKDPDYDAARDWNPRLEIADREANPGKPYVIAHEEFTDNEHQHEQSTVTYYIKDDQLVDEQDRPVDNTDYLVGEDNLTRFGSGSGDPNVVYVRNENISMDFEIILNRSSYKEAVLGFDDEDETSLRHSNRRRRRNWGTDE